MLQNLPTDNGINDLSWFGSIFKCSTISRMGFDVFIANFDACTFQLRFWMSFWLMNVSNCLTACRLRWMLENVSVFELVCPLSIVTEKQIFGFFPTFVYFSLVFSELFTIFEKFPLVFSNHFWCCFYCHFTKFGNFVIYFLFVRKLQLYVLNTDLIALNRGKYFLFTWKYKIIKPWNR